MLISIPLNLSQMGEEREKHSVKYFIMQISNAVNASPSIQKPAVPQAFSRRCTQTVHGLKKVQRTVKLPKNRSKGIKTLIRITTFVH